MAILERRLTEMANLGNAWHLPRNPQPPGQASMRFPVEDIDASVDVILTNGNQFRGAGNAANQTQSDSKLMIRRAGDSVWAVLPMQFQATAGNDKFFFATVPVGRFPPGAVVQYYFKIDYTDRNTTFLHGNDVGSFASNFSISPGEIQKRDFLFVAFQ